MGWRIAAKSLKAGKHCLKGLGAMPEADILWRCVERVGRFDWYGGGHSDHGFAHLQRHTSWIVLQAAFSYRLPCLKCAQLAS